MVELEPLDGDYGHGVVDLAGFDGGDEVVVGDDDYFDVFVFFVEAVDASGGAGIHTAAEQGDVFVADAGAVVVVADLYDAHGLDAGFLVAFAVGYLEGVFAFVDHAGDQFEHPGAAGFVDHADAELAHEHGFAAYGIVQQQADAAGADDEFAAKRLAVAAGEKAVAQDQLIDADVAGVQWLAREDLDLFPAKLWMQIIAHGCCYWIPLGSSCLRHQSRKPKSYAVQRL